MTVAYLDWGSDFVVTPNGSILMANGWDDARQSTVRAILTNPYTTLPSGQDIPPDYVYGPDYGAGLGLYVGQDMTTNQQEELKSKISAVVLGQPFVNSLFAPQIEFFNTGVNGVFISIFMTLVSHQTGTVAVQVN